MKTIFNHTTNMNQRKSNTFLLLFSILIASLSLGIYNLYFVYEGSNLRICAGILWIFIYLWHAVLMEHFYVQSCSTLKKIPQDFFADLKKLFSILATLIRWFFRLRLGCAIDFN